MLAAPDFIRSPSRVERRHDCRFPVAVPLEYSSPSHRGHAVTANLSSHGVLIETADLLRIGELIQLSLLWPNLLDEQHQLRLEITGVVLRRTTTGVAVSLAGGAFRVCPASVLPSTRN